MLHNLPKMVSYGVASATDPVDIGSESVGASAGSESGRASAGSATVGSLVVGDVAVPAMACWSATSPSRPQLGLVDTESIAWRCP